ncbi:MAG: MarR family winged helix-turn-helix transcriptional regulator [Leptothrix sp. (in: b-proteobacteria)]
MSDPVPSAAQNPAVGPPIDAANAPHFYRASGYRPDQSIGYLMRRVMQSIVTEADRRLAPHDLTHAQWLPLFKLLHGECRTGTELARDCQIDPGTMTRSLDRLEAKGLIRRERSQLDRRVVELALTADGQRIAPQIPAVLAEVLNAHLSGFSEAEWQQLLDLLNRMLKNGEALRA